MMRKLIVVVSVSAAAAVAFQVVFRTAGSSPPIPDQELGLRKTALADDRAPATYTLTDAAPGDNQRMPRAYDGAPPLIPHSLDGFTPITSSENTCLLCHQTGTADAADPPQVPVSHMTDLRNAPTVQRETVAGARWNCTACHVPQSNAPLLVANTFATKGK